MRTELVMTRLHYTEQGKIEIFSRVYLPTPEASAVAQAKEEFNGNHSGKPDSNTEVYCTVEAVTAESLRESFTREELPTVVGRVCALEAVANGAPAIPEGATFEAWTQNGQIDAFNGDCEFLDEVMGLVEGENGEEREAFLQAYLQELFDESPCGPAPARHEVFGHAISHHCSACGEEVSAYCQEHPDAMVDSIFLAPGEPPSEADTLRNIRALRTEAWKAEDEAQVQICDIALAGVKAAFAECARVISEAKAQD